MLFNSTRGRDIDTAPHGPRTRRYAHQHSEALFAPERRFPFRATRRPNTEVRLVAVRGDVAWVRRQANGQLERILGGLNQIPQQDSDS